MHFDLVDLRLFAAVAQEGSITRGAARAGLALASASSRIRGMEAALGTPLLQRERRGSVLTPAGDALAHHARLVLDQVESLRGELRAHASGRLRGNVRLLSNTAAIEEHLPDALGGWLGAHPGIAIDLQEKPSREVSLGVAQGHADAGILSDWADTAELEILPFRTDRLVLVTRRDDPAFAGRRQVSFEEVLGQDIIGLPQDGALAQHLDWQAARLGRVLRPRIRLRGFDGICRLVDQGAGVAIVPEIAARRCRRRKKIALIGLAEPWAVRQLNLCVRQLDRLPAHARDLVRHLAGLTVATGD